MEKNAFIKLALVYLPAIILPGPSITMILKNGLVSGRKSSILTSVGIMLGIACQTAAVLIGITFIEKNIFLFNGLKILCSSYLLYIGLKGILNSKKTNSLYIKNPYNTHLTTQTKVRSFC